MVKDQKSGGDGDHGDNSSGPIVSQGSPNHGHGRSAAACRKAAGSLRRIERPAGDADAMN